MAKPKQISDEVIYEIRRSYAKKEMTQVEIAKSHKISQSLVSKIVNNYIHKPLVGDLHIGGSAEAKMGCNYVN